MIGSPEGVAALVHGSLRRHPDEVLAQAAATLDLTRPVGVLLLAARRRSRYDT